MIKKFLALLVLLLAMAGCSTLAPAFNAERPGQIPFQGGTVQLLFSNPDYRDATDPLVRDRLMERRLFAGNRGSYPSTTGGIGLMATWGF